MNDGRTNGLPPSFFELVRTSEMPVLVDFWAEWCMPCRMLAPTIDEIAADYAGRVKVVKVNAEEEPELSGKYGIQGVPTLIFFRGGQEADRAVGLNPPAVLNRKFDDLAAEEPAESCAAGGGCGCCGC